MPTVSIPAAIGADLHAASEMAGFFAESKPTCDIDNLGVSTAARLVSIFV